MYYDKGRSISNIYKYHYNYRNYSTIIEEYDGNRHLLNKWFYNKDTLLIEAYKYYDNRDIHYAWFYSYDGFGRVVEETKLDYFGRVKRRVHYGYDSFGNLIALSIHNPLGLLYRWRINYDKNFDTTLCIKTDREFKVIESRVYYNNKIGKPDSIVRFDINNNLLGKYSYRYNDKGMRTGVKKYDNRRFFLYQWEYSFNKKGQFMKPYIGMKPEEMLFSDISQTIEMK